MKKFYIYLGLFVLFSFLLVACGASQSANGTPNPYAGPTTGVESTGTPSTLPATGQNITSTITGTTELPTQPITITSPVPSVVSTQTVTSTQGVPSTGSSSQSADPGLLSNQLQFQVVDQQNQPVGQVKDIVLDLTNLKVAYLIVGLSQTTGSTTAKQVAVPWSMLELQAASSSIASSNGYASCYCSGEYHSREQCARCFRLQRGPADAG